MTAAASEFIGIDRFGKDHWSLLGYVATCCMDGTAGLGTLDRRRVRCNKARHPMLVGAYAHDIAWQPAHGTRLRGFFDYAHRSDPQKAAAAGLQVLDHDDWDCLDDLEHAGLLEVFSEVNGTVKLTAQGMKVAADLLRHKAAGGQFAQFDPASPATV